MLSSFYSAISGLSASTSGINVVSNNIANMNTVGYKSSTAAFEDVLYQTINSSSGTSQVGRGTAVSSVKTDFSAGSLETTNSTTDLAIGGDGFFIVQDPDSGAVYYTRAGSFSFDSEGNLVDSDGNIVQGWEIDRTTGTRVGVYEDIVIPQSPSEPKASTFIAISCNLQQDATAPTAAFDPGESDSFNYTSSVTVYDSIGQSHTLSVYFVKTDTNEWAWHAIAPDAFGGAFEDEGTLNFTSEGLLDTSSGDPTMDLGVEYQEGITQTIELAFDGSLGGNATTQYAMASTTNFQTQDGYPPGTLESVSVSSDGTISGTYSNGQIRSLYQVTLADFNNPDGLKKEGGNLYSETLESGVPYTNSAGESGLGSISSNCLEQSNVDLAAEFVKLIIFQRGFQANSTVITTTDEVLQTLIGLKR